MHKRLENQNVFKLLHLCSITCGCVQKTAVDAATCSPKVSLSDRHSVRGQISVRSRVKLFYYLQA